VRGSRRGARRGGPAARQVCPAAHRRRGRCPGGGAPRSWCWPHRTGRRSRRRPARTRSNPARARAARLGGAGGPLRLRRAEAGGGQAGGAPAGSLRRTTLARAWLHHGSTAPMLLLQRRWPRALPSNPPSSSSSRPAFLQSMEVGSSSSVGGMARDDPPLLAWPSSSPACSLGRGLPAGGRKAASRRGGRGGREHVGEHDPFSTRCCLL
jgi:hypothetical protein